MRQYAALIMDLKKSRSYSIAERNDIQGYIMEVIHRLNYIFRSSIEKEVDFSAGDEVQGLFSSVEASYLYFRMFNMLVSPIEFRAGIGLGKWEVVLADARTTAQDGKAYHNARRAIEATEDSLGYSVLLFSDRKSDVIVNSLFNSTALIINKQSRHQNELMLLSELLFPINISHIIDVPRLNELISLIRHKNEFIKYSYFKSSGKNKISLFDRIDYYDIGYESQPLDAMKDCSSSFFVAEGKTRGLSTKIAEIIGVSRQSVEKTIKAANIYEARNLAIATLKFLKSLEEKK